MEAKAGLHACRRSFCMVAGEIFDSRLASWSPCDGMAQRGLLNQCGWIRRGRSTRCRAPRSSFCMAVGSSQPPNDDASNSSAAAAGRYGAIAERWNGQRWVAEGVFGSSDGEFTGVSCASRRACIAVGAMTPAARWNGRTWKLACQVQPDPLFEPAGACRVVRCC